MDSENKRIFQKLRDLRKARGMTVDTLATKMGENSQKVARIERGDRSLTVEYLMKASKALEAPAASFIDQDPKKSPFSPDTLHRIILWVEQNYSSIASKQDPKQKAQIISKLFALSSMVSAETQEVFLTSLLDLFALCKE